jgi:hypothetical protein
MIGVLSLVIVVSLAVGGLGLVGVIGVGSGSQARVSSAAPSPDRTTELPGPDRSSKPTTAPSRDASSPAPGLTPSEPDVPAFCDLAAQETPFLQAVGAGNPAESATITEEAKRAIATLREMAEIGPAEVREQSAAAMEYIDALQEFIETGEAGADYDSQRSAYNAAIAAIDQIREAACS